ncbi:MAG: helix-turn-helix transcriptional regulator [Butyrivibrio sp.]
MEHRREYDMATVGHNLKQLRLLKGLTVEDVREYLMLGTVQAIYKYESGAGYPQTDTMFALMELYDASLDDIVNPHEWGSECSPAA